MQQSTTPTPPSSSNPHVNSNTAHRCLVDPEMIDKPETNETKETKLCPAHTTTSSSSSSSGQCPFSGKTSTTTANDLPRGGCAFAYLFSSTNCPLPAVSSERDEFLEFLKRQNLTIEEVKSRLAGPSPSLQVLESLENKSEGYGNVNGFLSTKAGFLPPNPDSSTAALRSSVGWIWAQVSVLFDLIDKIISIHFYL